MILSLLSRRLACVGMTAVGLILTLAGSANATLIDSFETQFNGTLFTMTGMGAAQTEVNGSGIIGGQREMILEVEEGSLAFASVMQIDGDTLIQSQGFGEGRTNLTLTYDGLDGLSSFNDRGLGGLELSGANFLLRAMGNNPVVATIRVFTDLNNFSEGILTTSPTGMLFETFDIAFTDFQAVGGGGANFSDVGAIQIELSLTGNTTVAVAYDSIATDTGSLAIAPEPGSWALFGLGALGTIGYSRLRRRKSRIAKTE